MFGQLSRFMNLPVPLRIGLILAGGGGLMAVVFFLPAEARWIILIGLIAVAIILAGYAAVLRWMKKRKAAPMEQDILSNAATSPSDISEPARRARLDDLRKNFEEGTQKFKVAGKDLYSMPWYLVVGEPGAGKTEAIRHCNVGFPPGLQDRFQGAGGTINMNWWFTNHGVILDTAGRLMFEEVQAGKTNEWQEFLSLLGKHRPDCPVNGMLLVISAESLIADTADELERKGAKFAEQLDLVQRTLDIRFPVFVVVTKCDRIVGFKEFFENLEDPQSQHQMLGWSNPLPLDEAFRPELLDQHMHSLLEHLRFRRLGLILDPVHTEDPDARRTDQIDDMYAFPKQMAEVILPRLRRYMEMIFVAGEWSAKPLFLRGVYFTSSMREGAALDAELAEALGVGLESLPEGRVFTKDRAYFLRDLFLSKVFREKGLVTSATNATAQHRRRRITVLAAGFLTVAVLFFFTGYVAYALHSSIGRHRDYWGAAAEPFDGAYGWRPIVDHGYLGSTDYTYDGMQVIEIGKERLALGRFFKELCVMADAPIEAPWIFKLARLAVVWGGLDEPRDRAKRAVFEAGVLRPVLGAVRELMKVYSPEAWDDEATAALAQLVRVEALARYGPDERFIVAKGEAEEDELVEPLDLPRLFKVALGGSSKDYQTYFADSEGDQYHGAALREALNLACDTDSQGWVWPFESVGAGGAEARAAILAGISNYVEHTRSTKGFSAAVVEELKSAVQEHDKTEKALLEACAPATQPRTEEEFVAFKTDWDRWFAKLRDIADARRGLAERLGCGDPGDLSGWHETACKRQLEDIRGEFERFRAASLLGAAKAAEGEVAPAESEEASPPGDILVIVDGKLNAAFAGMEKMTSDPANIAALQKADSQYRRFRMLALADAQLAMEVADADIAEELARIGKARASAGDEVRKLWGDPPAEEHKGVAECAIHACDLGARRAVRDALMRSMETADAMAADIPAHVRLKAAESGQTQDPEAVVPFTALESFDAGYFPGAVSDLVKRRGALGAGVGAGGVGEGAQLNPLDGNSLRELYRRQQETFDAYLLTFARYWAEKVPDDGLAITALAWAEFSGQLRNIQEWVVNSRLKKAVEKIRGAMNVAAEAAPVTNESAGKEIASLVKASVAKVQHTLKTLENEDLKKQCQRFFASWQQMDANYAKARAELLRLEPADFRRDYLVLFDEAPDYAIEYYRRLALGMLEAIAGKFQDDSKTAATDVITRYGKRFPLSPLSAGGAELKAEEFNECRLVLARMAAPPVAGGKKVFASGAKLADREMDAAFDALLHVRLKDQRENDWLEKTKRLFDVIPEKGVTCQVWVPGAQRQTELTEQAGLADKAGVASWIWTRVSLNRGEIEGKRAKIGDEVNLGSVDSPAGEPVQLLLWQFGDEAQPDRRLRIDSVWGCIWMLHQRREAAPWEAAGESRVKAGGAQRSTEDPRKWTVRIDLLDEPGNLRVLWIELRFEQALPELSEWPSLN